MIPELEKIINLITRLKVNQLQNFLFSLRILHLYKLTKNIIKFLQLFHSKIILFYNKMKIRRTDSQGETFHFFRIKDLHFFRHLLWRYDLSLLKDYLHRELQLLPVAAQTPQRLLPSRIYIPNQDALIKSIEGKERTTIKSGHVFPQSICQFLSQNEFTLYSISKRAMLILERLYFLELPLMNGMKSSEKFHFLQRCQVAEIHFNSFVYRRGEDVDAVYYLLEGQMKMFKELGENFYQIASLEQGRMFGIFQVKAKVKKRQLYAKASMNSTKFLKIPIKLAEKVCFEHQTTIEAAFADAQSEIYSMMSKRTSEQKGYPLSAAEGKMDFSNRVMLERRLKTFENSRMIHSSVIENLVYSKKMLYRVKELNERMQKSSNRSARLEIEDPHAVRHFNDKWRCQKQLQKMKPVKSREPTMGVSRTPFKRLLKYPSVQCYLGLESPTSSAMKSLPAEYPPASI